MKIDKKSAALKLSIIFSVNFACLGGTNVLVSFIYDKIGLYNLGQTNYFATYLGFFISNFFARNILGWFKELKNAMFTGFIFYGFTILAAIVTYSCYYLDHHDLYCSTVFLRVLNIVAGFNLGFFGATLVFSGQYQYIDKISTAEEKSELFAIFYSNFQFNGIAANLLNITFYTFKINSLICFIVFLSFFCLSTFLMIFLVPKIYGYNPHDIESSAGEGTPVESLAISNQTNADNSGNTGGNRLDDDESRPILYNRWG